MTILEWHAHFEDTGCWASPKCLDCPLPQCVHDLPPGGPRRAKASTAQRLTLDAFARLLEAHPGRTRTEVMEITAAEMRITMRSVQRHLAAAKAAGGAPCP